MIRLPIIVLLVSILVSMSGCQLGKSSDANRVTDVGKPEYFRAMHGFDGGQTEMVDLSKLEGFDTLRTIDDVAKFAAKVPGAIGFTAHPDFQNDTRLARAVIWYTGLSSPQNSWPLYLFDETEAKKKPGEKPRAEALAAAEAKVIAKMETAKELIKKSGSSGVKLSGTYHEQKALALAIIRLGGSFEHVGEFGTSKCVGCRSVVAGGTPRLCGLGVQKKKHWNCCGSTKEKGHCQYWQLIKVQDETNRLWTPRMSN